MHWRGKWQPLQGSSLENPRDRGAWWAAVYGVAQSRTRLSDLAAVAAAADETELLFLMNTIQLACEPTILFLGFVVIQFLW